MSTVTRVSDLSRREIRSSLREGSLLLHLGPFAQLISGSSDPLIDFLQDTYRDCQVELFPSDVTDVHLNLRAPNILRKFFRPQVVPDPGFEVPAVPLPIEMAPLAFEMGLNLSVALKCCRFVTIHAGVVADKDGAILMSAESGSGKSTLTAALLERGYRLFSDEFALVGLGDAVLQPYPRPISLKEETIPIVRELAGDEWISPIVKGSPKGDIAYRRARRSDIDQSHKQAKAKLILFPEFEPGMRPYKRRLNTAEAILRLIPASTNFGLLGEQAYLAITRLFDDAVAYELSYGSTEQSLSLIDEALQERDDHAA
ncbi:HprK-related kinase A [Kordiimonas aquimaris]|uniref:HprK-related kinase A n=1 Tax=Kordiimonas aquimaris TaxID=707591 RepID=UPI0021D0ABE9|nr:HprK-related kinase A [Kordiimonas aquimaris]